MSVVNPNPPGISAPKKHAYVRGCDCKRCTREWVRRSAQSDGIRRQETAQRKIRGQSVLSRRHESASRAEQHARYIDCGPGAWDERS